MHVAVIGCSHGEVDKIYEVIETIEKRNNINVDLVLCCGDFQSVRNMTDLRCMACPIKYQAMHDFYRYYSGEKKAPKLTIFIGGNHEASNFLQELPYGGWVAPNIYYCGYVSVLRFGPLRIAGLSGIYKGHDYLKGRHEAPPYDGNTMRSVYHYRNLDIFRLKQMKTVDIMLSHDWPQGIQLYGNTNQLLRLKPFFREEVQRDELGCRPLAELLNLIQPRYWFAAHLHVKFPAIVPHQVSREELAKTSTESESTSPESDGSAKRPTESKSEGLDKATHFLALDKVLPGRPFLQIIEIPSEERPEEGYRLSYDPEWLAVLKSTDSLLVPKNIHCYMPNETGTERYDFSPSDEELAEINEIFGSNFVVPENFEPTAAAYVEGEQPRRAFPVANPQTTEFCDKLGIRDPIRLVADLRPPDFSSFGEAGTPELDISLNESTQITLNPDEISLDDDDDDEGGGEGDDVDSKLKTKVDQCSSSSEQIASRKLSKLSLPPPKSEESTEVLVNTPEAKARDTSFSTELDILRSVMGSAEGAAGTTSSSSSSSEVLTTESGISFTLDRVGEPEMKRRRNQSLFEQLENE